MGNGQLLTFYILYVIFYENALFISINKFTKKVIKETKNIMCFWCTTVIHTHTHTHTHTHIFYFIFFPIMDYHRILNILPYNLVVYFIYNSLCLLISNS